MKNRRLEDLAIQPADFDRVFSDPRITLIKDMINDIFTGSIMDRSVNQSRPVALHSETISASRKSDHLDNRRASQEKTGADGDRSLVFRRRDPLRGHRAYGWESHA
ncbi:hypothetical protein [Methylobacterium sp. 37f]|uniref:hypothetical protein n=1 Tax=Methylobacterium sp. 37f TaxID=2817058 RepID=UPI001FFC8E9D|nr:hypothetical protein [Methylobacterium sp. 37f]MCK2053817.1 hypothetical protein [Methylobacterium sp. 37f]